MIQNYDPFLDMTASNTRRKFIAHGLSCIALLSIGFITDACRSKNKTSQIKQSIDPCNDLTSLDESDLEKRKVFAYVRPGPDALKRCQGCKLFLPAKPGEQCGKCLLFKGPVDLDGSCTYWAPLD